MGRKEFALATAGLALMVMVVTYFMLSAPWANPPTSEEQSNPTVVFAPFFFILGVVLLFLSPVVYELLPEESDSDG